MGAGSARMYVDSSGPNELGCSSKLLAFLPVCHTLCFICLDRRVTQVSSESDLDSMLLNISSEQLVLPGLDSETPQLGLT